MAVGGVVLYAIHHCIAAFAVAAMLPAAVLSFAVVSIVVVGASPPSVAPVLFHLALEKHDLYACCCCCGRDDV